MITTQRGKVAPYKYKRVKCTAVPHIFPGLPTYLNKPSLTSQSCSATSSSRHFKTATAAEEKATKFFQEDQVSSLQELCNRKFDFPSSWRILSQSTENKIWFEEVTLDDDVPPSLRFSLTINEELDFLLFC
jgi:hypothetical protein